jgi:hypothetical protein
MIYEKEGMNNIKLGSLVKIDRGCQGDGSFDDSILYIVGKLYPDRVGLCMCIPITRFKDWTRYYYASNLVLVSSGL